MLRDIRTELTKQEEEKSYAKYYNQPIAEPNKELFF